MPSEVNVDPAEGSTLLGHSEVTGTAIDTQPDEEDLAKTTERLG